MKKWLKGIDWRIALIAALFTAFIFQAKKNFFDDEKQNNSDQERIIIDE